jgi:hypothetical protein
VKLTEEKVVFSVGALVFEGDLPAASIFHLQLVVSDIAEWNATAQAVAVFHTNAGHVRLHDGAYNADWNMATANPYKELLADLRKHGVQLELCGRLRRLTTGETRICRNQDQRECHGERHADRSRRICENH